MTLDELPELEGELLVNGSGQLVQSLLERGLVDELRLMVFPTVLGTGRRLFGETPSELPFRLVKSTPVGDDGVTILVYQPATPEAPEGHGSVNAVGASEGQPRLARLAHLIVRRRKIVIAAWIVLTLFGAFSAGQVSKRWFESFSIPGYSSYEANQRTLKTFGTGEQAPLVAVFHSDGDITQQAGIQKAVAAAAAVNPGSRDSSYFSTGENRAYVSKDGHTMFAEIYPPKSPTFSSSVHLDEVRAKLKEATPAGVQAYLTGRDPLYDASTGGSSGGPSVLTEALIGGLGCLVILFFVFGTLPAVLMPIVVAIAAILNTFTLVWILTYITNVSIIVQFLIALVGLGVAIDYALADDLPLPRRAARGRGRRDGARSRR